MSGHKLRYLGFGLVTTAGAGLLALTAMMNSAFAYGDDIGLVMGGSENPVPGPTYVGAADELYLNNPITKLYPDLTFYQATPANPLGNGLFTPEGAYPLFSGGVHQLYYNYPFGADGLAGPTTSVGQGATILESTILSNAAAGDMSTAFGESQSSTLSGVTMQLLDPSGTPSNIPAQFLLIADPNAPNGGLFERFNGYETINGDTHVLPLNVASIGLSFNGATPADDFTANIYSQEYDGLADFPRYPLNFLSDLNAFLGVNAIHGTYLNAASGESGPTAVDIADAHLLPGSALDGTTDSLTNYHMIDTIDGGTPITAPLVSLLDSISKPLGDLLGPDLTVLINLGYGSLTQGWSPDPANIPTPFGLWPTNISLTDLLTALGNGAQQGLSAFESDLSNLSLSSLVPATSSVAAVVPAAAPTLTEIVNALSSAASTAYSTLLPTADFINALISSIPNYDLSLIVDNLQTGDLLDAFGLPVAANTGLFTLVGGFEYSVLSEAASQIAATLASIGL